MKNEKRIVPDTSILIQGKLSELIEKKKLKDTKIIIPRLVVDELQAQASTGRDIGFKGLGEIKKIRRLGKKANVTVEFRGERPTIEEIQLARKGRIDALIKDFALKEKAKLLTGDYVQALVAEAEGLEVEHVSEEIKKRIRLEDFFDKDTQSVHLKVDVFPMAKKGRPGNVRLIKIRNSKCTEKEIKAIIEEIHTKVRKDRASFIEISKSGATVIQMNNFRISVTRPPFSEALELTAVRPIVKIKLSDYKLHKELEKRIVKGSRGVLIAGPPGSGKSSFASALAEYLSSKEKIVKTFEQPRDLQVGPEITQYGPLEGDWNKTAEILLLVRPDYTFFDEVRNTRDFKVFSDMRLAGVGMVGVLHSTNPISAIQRFVGRVELGVIPHVIDTVIYIKDGKIERVFELKMLVKVPTGMTESDLARPVIEIRDYDAKKLMFEIYSYGEENVVIPITEGEKKSPLLELAKEKIIQELRNYDPNPMVEISSDNRIIVRVKDSNISRLIGKKGSNIDQIEKKLGIHISVEPKEGTLKDELSWGFEETGAYMNIRVNEALVGKSIDIYHGSNFLFSAYVGKSGQIRVKKKSAIGKSVLVAIASNNLRVLG